MTLKDLRKSQGMSQQKLADMIALDPELDEVSRQSVSAWERGTRTPSRAVARRIAEIFCRSFSEIDLMFLNGGKTWDQRY